MIVVGFFSWWYGGGWRQRVVEMRDMLLHLYDYFSIDILVRTWFAPFRQISAERVQGPAGVQLRAWFDKLISRFIGAFIRSVTIIAGIVVLTLAALFALVQVVIWPIVPLLPIVLVVLSVIGWVPWRV